MVCRTGMLERAIATLAAAAEPLPADTTLDRLGIERSGAPLEHRLSRHQRFVWVGRNASALAEGVTSGYTSIRDAH